MHGNIGRGIYEVYKHEKQYSRTYEDSYRCTSTLRTPSMAPLNDTGSHYRNTALLPLTSDLDIDRILEDGPVGLVYGSLLIV